MASKSKGGGLKLYKSYSFREKDPIIDKLRTVIADEGASYSDIEKGSGVTTSTLYNWFSGTTRRPQFATVMAVARSLNWDLKLAKRVMGMKAGPRTLSDKQIKSAIKKVREMRRKAA